MIAELSDIMPEIQHKFANLTNNNVNSLINIFTHGTNKRDSETDILIFKSIAEFIKKTKRFHFVNN